MTPNFQKFQVMLLIVFTATVVLVFALPAGAATIDVSVNGNIQNWALTPGSTNENSTASPLTVTTTGANTWSVLVYDNLDNGKNSTSAGKMLEYNLTTSQYVDTGHSLGANLTVDGGSGDSVVGYPATLGPAMVQIEGGTGDVNNEVISVTISQQVATTDLHLTNGNVYRGVITFVGEVLS